MIKLIRNTILIGLLTVVVVASMDAQSRYFDERYIYSQYYLYPTLINPGAIGAEDYQEVMVNYRNTWSTFDGAPKTFTVGYNGQLGNKLGFGAQVMSDSYGSLKTNKGQIGFSYTIETPINKIGLGLTGEYIQHSLDGSGLNSPEVNSQDALIIERLSGVQFFDASFGIYGLYDGKLSYGLTFPSLISSEISDTESNADKVYGYIFQLGYHLKSESTGITFYPNVAVKSLMNTPTHIDINAKFGFLEDKLFSGVSYTLGGDERYGFLIGTTIESLSLAYSYNLSNAEFQTYNNGSHELSASLRFGNKSNESQEAKMMIKEAE